MKQDELAPRPKKAFDAAPVAEGQVNTTIKAAREVGEKPRRGLTEGLAAKTEIARERTGKVAPIQQTGRAVRLSAEQWVASAGIASDQGAVLVGHAKRMGIERKNSAQWAEIWNQLQTREVN